MFNAVDLGQFCSKQKVKKISVCQQELTQKLLKNLMDAQSLYLIHSLPPILS